jgi:hypothetical protein
MLVFLLLETPALAANIRAPIVLSLSKSSGPVTGGQRITIIGANFDRVKNVNFGSVAGTSVDVISSTRLTVIVPTHVSGTVNVVVLTLFGISRSLRADHFTFVANGIASPILDIATPIVNVGSLPSPIVPTSWSGPNPPTNCLVPNHPEVILTGIVGLDYCGATLEGLAPLPLPSNWMSLSDSQQGFVLMNLERLERGETPIVGISNTLDNYATDGANADTDPPVSFITDGVGGSIWDGGDFVTWGMVGYLYYDGPGGSNLDCTESDASGCWGHRDNILDSARNPNLAVGVSDGPDGDSAAVISDQFTDINFSWATELEQGYMSGLPTNFILTPPSITGVTNNGNGLITLTGIGLDTATEVYFSNILDPNQFHCASPSTCEVEVPSGLSLKTIYNVYMLNPTGLSAVSPEDRYTNT